MNELTGRIAKHLCEVYFGGNWSGVHLEQIIEDVTWREATTTVHGFNSIATLVYHMNYYVNGVSKVLDGGPLDIRDKFSFTHPPVESPEDWTALLTAIRADARRFADQIQQLPDSILTEEFTDGKYGDYYRNLQGIVEHFHYHLGQIVLVKRLVRASKTPSSPAAA